MAKVEIYTTMWCPFCHRAKQLLSAKGIDFTEIDVDTTGREQMLQRSGGRRTVPQIFIDDRHVGGCDDLFALERAGKLDPLLQPAA